MAVAISSGETTIEAKCLSLWQGGTELLAAADAKAAIVTLGRGSSDVSCIVLVSFLLIP